MEILLAENSFALLDFLTARVEEWQQQVVSNLGKKGSKGFVIVPDNQGFAVEQHYLRKSTKSSLLLAEVLGWQRLFYRLIDDMGIKYGSLLDKNGQLAVLNYLLYKHSDELPFLGKLIGKRGYLRQINDVLLEFRRLNIDAHNLEEVLQNLADEQKNTFFANNHFADWAKLLNYYQEYLRENDCYDQKARLHKLAELLEELVELQGKTPVAELPEKYAHLAYLKDAEIWYWGIGENYILTTDEKRIIAALEKLVNKQTFFITADGVLAKSIDKIMIADLNKVDEFNDEIKVADSDEFYFSYRLLDFLIENLPVNSLTKLKVQTAGEASTDRLEFDENRNELPKIIKVEVASKAVGIRLCLAELLRLHVEDKIEWREMAIIADDDFKREQLLLSANNLGVPIHFTQNLQLAASPLFKLVFAFWAMPAANWSIEAVMKYLRSGLVCSDQGRLDRVENFWLANGIDHHSFLNPRRYKLEVAENGEVCRKTPDDRQERMETDGDPGSSYGSINHSAYEFAQRFIAPAYEFWQKMPKQITCQTLLKMFWEFLAEIDCKKNIEYRWQELTGQEQSQAAILYSKSWQELRKMAKLLSKLQKDMLIDPLEFGTMLRDLLMSLEVDVMPNRLQQVTVATFGEVIRQKRKIIYYLDAQAEPLRQVADNALLHDFERSFLADILQVDWITEGKNNYYRLQGSLHRFKLACDGTIYLSRQDDDFAEICRGLQIIDETEVRKFAVEPHAYDVRWLYKFYREREEQQISGGNSGGNSEPNGDSKQTTVEAAVINKILGKGNLFSVSQFERYNSCPYQYFVDYILKAKPRLIWQPQALDEGILLHAVLQTHMPRLFADNQDWQSLLAKLMHSTWAERSGTSESWLNEIITSQSELAVFHDEGIKSSITRQLGLRLSKSMPNLWQSFLTNDNERGSLFYHPVAYEWAFGFNDKPLKIDLSASVSESATKDSGIILPSDLAVCLRGKIDRIDILQASDNQFLHKFRIVDYKLSNRQVNLERIYHGLDLQLPVYLMAVQELFRGQNQIGDEQHSTFAPEDAGYFGLRPVEPEKYQFEGLKKHLAKQKEDKVLWRNIDEVIDLSKKNIARTALKIFSGSFPPQPCALKYGDNLPCKYCRYRSICALDKPENAVKYLVGYKEKNNGESNEK